MKSLSRRAFDHAIASGDTRDEKNVLFLKREERKAGWLTIAPGDVPWMPEEEWDGSSVVSVRGNVVRFILLRAANPGTGAFTRMIEGLLSAGLTPHVIEPTREFAAALRRRGWVRQDVTLGDEEYEIRMVARAHAKALPPA